MFRQLTCLANEDTQKVTVKFSKLIINYKHYKLYIKLTHLLCSKYIEKVTDINVQP